MAKDAGGEWMERHGITAFMILQNVGTDRSTKPVPTVSLQGEVDDKAGLVSGLTL